MTGRPLIDRAGIRTDFHWNNDGTFTVNTTQDVEPILELNKKAANHYGKSTRHRDVLHVASIPVTVQYEWAKRYGILNVCDEEYWPKIRALLNDPDWRYLKCSEILL